MQFDARSGDLTLASLGIFSRFSDSWDLSYLLTHRKGTAKEDELEFRVGFRMIEF